MTIFYVQITKLDVTTGDVIVYSKEDIHMTDVVFIPRPGAEVRFLPIINLVTFKIICSYYLLISCTYKM